MSLVRGALVAALSASCCLGQTGTVTFYTPGDTVKSAAASVLPSSRQPFAGWLFDGTQRMSYVHPGRFLSVRLPAGTHLFSVAAHAARPGRRTLVLKVAADHSYCVRLYSRVTNFEMRSMQFVHNRIEQLPCPEARRQAAHLKPIESKWIDPAFRAEQDTASSFPAASPSAP